MSRRRQREGQQDHVRVRMNLHTASLVAIVLAMAYAGAVQTNGAAYLLAFVTAGLGGLSYIHARANLKGIQIVPGAASPGVAGQAGTLPITLRATSGLSPCGLEILAVGSRKASLLDRIRSGDSARIPVILPPEAEGLRKTVRLLVRSAYPLGLFSAERQIEVDCLRRVHPRPFGDLPLPAPDPALRNEALAFASQASRPAREGDDFAGLREWQRGDSLRHVDWRALARGRPLMVKTWSGGAPEALRLDWHELPLTEHERLEQLAKWIDTCEARGLPYALHLPGCEVPVGLGPAHAQRCLNALADLAVRSAVPRQDDAKRSRTPVSHERAAHLPGRPLALLCVGLLLAALPLWQVAAVASLAVLALCIFARWWWRPRALGGWIPAAVAVAGVAGVGLQHGSIVSTEAGISILLVLQGCKLLEARSPHDFQVLAMIGWFVCLCGILAEQSLGQSIYSVAVFAWIAVCMIRFRRSTPGLRAPMRLAGLLLAQALPVAALLFVLFPRATVDALARRIGTGQTTTTGVPTELEPGTIARVVASDASAFRAKFPDGWVPPSEQRYWRCVVLWECQGLSWRKGPSMIPAPLVRYEPRAGDVRHEIDMEPHGQFWMPALDKPIRGPAGSDAMVPDFDDTLQVREPLRRPRRAAIFSRLSPQGEPLPETHRRVALRTPAEVGERMRALAQQWRANATSDVQVVQAGLAYLQQQGFAYTLDPGEFTGRGALEEFWFDRKQGFCSHYSAAYATLMRLAGIPSRIVMGYLGGAWNSNGNYLLVRQSDAHAWVEVWLEQSGWTRIDPTAVLAPSRLRLDLQGSLLGDEEAANRRRNSLWWRAYDSAMLFWDNVSYQWDTRVIQYDEETQVDWLGAMGLQQLAQDRKRDLWLLAACGVVVVLGLGLLTLWLRRPARHRDPWARAWQELCRRLTRLGLPARHVSEGPIDYAQRVRAAAPAHLVSEIDRLAVTYANARYGETSPSLRQYRRDIRRLRRSK
jgi:transglutaminase-like putative cysteine protease/uncharacterized protein (DUF58 family)